MPGFILLRLVAMKVEIKIITKVKLKNPVIIEGFPGIGMLGTIGTSYLAEKLEMKMIGYFASPHFPPIAAIHDYKPVYPARIYASEKYNLIVLFSEFVIPAEAVYLLSQEIIAFAKEINAKAIYSLAGIGSDTPGQELYGIASTPELADKLKAAGVQLVKEGATQGVSGVLIAECAAEQFPAANIMAQTSQPLDPMASARLLSKVAQIAGFTIDTSTLQTQGGEIQSKLKQSIEKIKTMHQSYNQMQDNPMYA